MEKILGTTSAVSYTHLGSLFHILQHLLALPVNRFAFKFFRLVVTDADDIPFRPVFKFLRMEDVYKRQVPLPAEECRKRPE